MCRKLETEAEKVLPFYVSSLLPEEEDDVAAAMQEAPSEPLAEVTKYAVWTFICPIVQLLFRVSFQSKILDEVKMWWEQNWGTWATGDCVTVVLSHLDGAHLITAKLKWVALFCLSANYIEWFFIRFYMSILH